MTKSICHYKYYIIIFITTLIAVLALHAYIVISLNQILNQDSVEPEDKPVIEIELVKAIEETPPEVIDTISDKANHETKANSKFNVKPKPDPESNSKPEPNLKPEPEPKSKIQTKSKPKPNQNQFDSEPPVQVIKPPATVNNNVAIDNINVNDDEPEVNNDTIGNGDGLITSSVKGNEVVSGSGNKTPDGAGNTGNPGGKDQGLGEKDVGGNGIDSSPKTISVTEPIWIRAPRINLNSSAQRRIPPGIYRVSLSMTVNTNSSTSNIEITKPSGNEIIDDLAIRAIKNSKLKPFQANDPIVGKVNITLQQTIK